MQMYIILTPNGIVAYGDTIKPGLGIRINYYLCGITQPIDIDCIVGVGD
jgi:hypothetical protein